MENCEDLLSPFYAALSSELSSNSLNFPTSFNLLKRALAIMDNPNSMIKDYATLVQSEPILLAKVLRMANSVAMNPYGREVTGAFEAVQRLGSKKIRCLVYLVVMEQVRQDNRSEELKRLANILWKHSVDVACLSYAFAKRTGICEPDEAMLSGIMIDIGQFFIISRIPAYPEILSNTTCMTELIKNSHISVAKQIIDTMKLPRVVIDVYNCNLKLHPVWPMLEIADVITLSSICTNFRNPFLQTVDDLKKQAFYEELTNNDTDSLERMLDDIDPMKTEMFNSMCM